MAVASWQAADPVGAFATAGVSANWCGVAGSRVAAGLAAAMGSGVWLLLGGLFALDWRLLTRKPIADPGLRLTGLLVQVAAICVLLHLAIPLRGSGHVVGNGGYVGATGSLLLRQHFSTLGIATLVATLLLVGGVLAGEHALLRVTARTLWRLAVVAGTMVLLPLTIAGRLARGAGALRLSRRARKLSESDNATDPVDAADLRDAAEAAERAIWDAEGDARLVDESEDHDSVGQALEPNARFNDSDFDEAVEDITELATVAAKTDRPANRFKVNAPICDRPQAFEGLAATTRAHTLPPLDLLADSEDFPFEELAAKAEKSAEMIQDTFSQFGLNVQVTEIDTGPVVTQFELDLEPGLPVRKVANLMDDLAIALRVPSVRLVSPIPGRNTVGVEVPNARRVNVRLRELIEATSEETTKMALPLFLGKDVSGGILNVDLAKMPHLLIAGRTGTGKSVCLNTLIVSLLMTRTPDECRMLMIDPKMVELSPYKRVPHLMHPVITDMKKAEAVLAWAVEKMEERYTLLAEVGVRQLSAYNKLGRDEVLRRLELEDDDEAAESIPDKMPSIVIVADEMADMMMTCGQEVQAHIIRLAQKARAVGIHLVLATQKPTVDVITGLIKSNLPARISFQVATKTDSRVVLDANGADKLLGNGDMLYLPPGTSTLERAQGTFCSDEEVMAVIEHFGDREPQYSEELKAVTSGSAGGGKGLEAVKDRDDLYRQAVELVISEQLGSISLLQRHLSVGYGRAGKMIDHMFEDGIVGDRNGAKPREVLFTMEDWEDFVAENGLD